MPPREYIFVLDVSGSMHGFPLDTAKKLMGDLVNVLRPSDTFNIVVFADGSDTFSPASVPATRANLARALQFIGEKNGGGGTRLLAALATGGGLPRQPGVSRSIVLRDRRLHRRGIGRVRLRPRPTRRRQFLRVRHREQREPVPHRRRRAGRPRRAVHRHGAWRGDGGSGAAPPLHRHARAHRDRREVPWDSTSTTSSRGDPGLVCQPPDRRLR